MDDQTREYIIGVAMQNLKISHNQAKLRLDAIVKSGLLERYEHVESDNVLFRFMIDIAIQIPQLGAA